MFNKINYYNYRLKAKLSFFQQIIILCDRFDLPTLLIFAEVEALRTVVLEAVRISRILNKSELTVLVKLYDLKRDNLIRCLNHLFKGFSYHFDEEKIKAAELCLAIVDRFESNIPNLQYNDETVVVNDVCAALVATEESKAAVECLDVTEIVEKLKEKNQDFSSTLADRQIETSEKTTVTFVDLLKDAEMKFQEVQDMIFAYSKTTDKAPYEPLIAVLNNVIEEFNQQEDNKPNKSAKV